MSERDRRGGGGWGGGERERENRDRQTDREERDKRTDRQSGEISRQTDTDKNRWTDSSKLADCVQCPFNRFCYLKP